LRQVKAHRAPIDKFKKNGCGSQLAGRREGVSAMAGQPYNASAGTLGDGPGGGGSEASTQPVFNGLRPTIADLDEAPPTHAPGEIANQTGEGAFLRICGDDDACLDWLMRIRFGTHIDCPKCGRNGKFHKLRQHPAYACQWCGCHLHPTAGTRFDHSRVGLRTWFRAIYLFSNGGNGPSARQLQQTLGVTYKTAWRMRDAIVDAKFGCANAGRKAGTPGFDALLSVLLSPAH